MNRLPTLDAHAHIDPGQPALQLAQTGAVLAMTLSLEEAAQGVARSEPWIAWGVGCHPRQRRAQEAFQVDRFWEWTARAAVVGEIGLDGGSRVPLELQRKTFRQILEVLQELPRLASIHSFRATRMVLDELRHTPIAFPVLHWWTGTAEETEEAAGLGCYFSVHPAVARQSKFRTRVPPERLLVESDHGYNDPPAAIPCRVEWVEHLLGQQLHMEPGEVRELAWRNLARIVRQSATGGRLPRPVAEILFSFDQP